MWITIKCIRKISQQKKLHFKPNKTYVEQSKDIFAWKKEHDPVELAGTSFCDKNVLGKNDKF